MPYDTAIRTVPDGIYHAAIDADGFDDVYLCNVGRNTLLRNNGDGTFSDVTVAAGVDDERWSSSAAWADSWSTQARRRAQSIRRT